MKKLYLSMIVFCLLLIASASMSFAQDVVLMWDDPNPVGVVDLFQVEMDGQIVADIVPTDTTYSVIVLADGQHTARVRAHSIWGWSDFSAPFDFTKGVPSGAVNLRLEVRQP